MEDDGAQNERPIKSGMGLLGMRERVAALGGRLTFDSGRNGGSVLRVVIQAMASGRPAEASPANAEVAA